MNTARWDAELYAANTAHHRAYDDVALSGVDLHPGDRVLDVGCGAGDLTATVAARVPDGLVVGLDPQPDLVALTAAQPAVNLHAVVGTAQTIAADAAPWAPYDVVLSTAALHWVPAADHPGVLAGIASVLRPGGMLRLEMGGQGQIAEARAVLDEVAARHGLPPSPWYFPAPEEYVRLLTAAGLDLGTGWCRLLSQRRAVADADALRGWLRSQVLIAYTAGRSQEVAGAFGAEAEEACLATLRRPDGSYDQDYVRLDVLAHLRVADLSTRLRDAHRRVDRIDLPASTKERLRRRLIALTDASKHDLATASARLDALLADLDAGRYDAEAAD